MNKLKETKYTTKTYEYNDDFMVDITKTDTTYEVYLYDKNYGVKQLVFGCDKDSTSYENLIRVVITELEYGKHIELYQENVY